MTEQLELFVDNTDINVSVLAKSSIYQDCMGIESKFTKKNHFNSNAYLLLFNYLFGMLCAGINQMSLEEYRKLTDEIAKLCIEKKVLLSGAEIDALSLLVMYYQELVKGFESHQNSKITYSEAFQYGRFLAKRTEENDYLLLEKLLYKDFSIADSPFTLSNALSARRNEFEKDNDIFFNILDNG